MHNPEDGNQLESQMVKLKQLEFMKAINQMQIQKIKADVQPKQCKSYSLRRKDITIRHVSQKQGNQTEDHINALKDQPLIFDDF